jgi:hypothetical protein
MQNCTFITTNIQWTCVCSSCAVIVTCSNDVSASIPISHPLISPEQQSFKEVIQLIVVALLRVHWFALWSLVHDLVNIGRLEQSYNVHNVSCGHFCNWICCRSQKMGDESFTISMICTNCTLDHWIRGFKKHLADLCNRSDELIADYILDQSEFNGWQTLHSIPMNIRPLKGTHRNDSNDSFEVNINRELKTCSSS